MCPRGGSCVDTHRILEAIAKFLRELGYKSAEGTVPTSKTVQTTIEDLTKSLGESPKVLQLGTGGLTLSREEGESGPLVLRVGLFDVHVERLERDGQLLLTSLRVLQPGENNDI